MLIFRGCFLLLSLFVVAQSNPSRNHGPKSDAAPQLQQSRQIQYNNTQSRDMYGVHKSLGASEYPQNFNSHAPRENHDVDTYYQLSTSRYSTANHGSHKNIGAQDTVDQPYVKVGVKVGYAQKIDTSVYGTDYPPTVTETPLTNSWNEVITFYASNGLLSQIPWTAILDFNDECSRLTLMSQIRRDTGTKDLMVAFSNQIDSAIDSYNRLFEDIVSVCAEYESIDLHSSDAFNNGLMDNFITAVQKSRSHLKDLQTIFFRAVNTINAVKASIPNGTRQKKTVHMTVLKNKLNVRVEGDLGPIQLNKDDIIYLLNMLLTDDSREKDFPLIIFHWSDFITKRSEIVQLLELQIRNLVNITYKINQMVAGPVSGSFNNLAALRNLCRNFHPAKVDRRPPVQDPEITKYL